jgi:hypothetical protein
MIEMFDPPILLNRERLPELPTTITTPGEASAVLHMLPTCGIQWCGVVACLRYIDRHDEAKARARDRAGTVRLPQSERC